MPADSSKPYVNPIPPDEARGLVAKEYAAAVRRAGRIWNIVSIQSHNPEAMRDSMRLYRSSMYNDSQLSRAQREMVAVVVSTANECHY